MHFVNTRTFSTRSLCIRAATLTIVSLAAIMPRSFGNPNSKQAQAYRAQQRMNQLQQQRQQAQQRQQQRQQQQQQRQQQQQQRQQQRINKNTYAIRNERGQMMAVRPSPNQSRHQRDAALKKIRADSKAQAPRPRTLEQRKQTYRERKLSKLIQEIKEQKKQNAPARQEEAKFKIKNYADRIARKKYPYTRTVKDDLRIPKETAKQVRRIENIVRRMKGEKLPQERSLKKLIQEIKEQKKQNAPARKDEASYKINQYAEKISGRKYPATKGLEGDLRRPNEKAKQIKRMENIVRRMNRELPMKDRIKDKLTKTFGSARRTYETAPDGTRRPVTT
jgi:hypothetical protein